MGEVKTVGVIGAGTMGHGIAWVASLAGYPTLLQDESPTALRQGMEKILRGWERGVEKGRIRPEERDLALKRLKVVERLEDLAASDLLIEAVTEDRALKRRLFARLDKLAPKGALLATNTSSLSITDLAASTQRSHRVIGIHFMNPVPVLPLVELIRGLQTSEETAAEARAWAESLGKTVVEAKDSPGFIANRILLPMINEAIFALYEGVGSAEAIDSVMRLGMNHPIGPLALADLIGLDTCLAILEVLHEGFGDPKYRPCPLLRQMVAAGLLGRKSGRGFYPYP